MSFILSKALKLILKEIFGYLLEKTLENQMNSINTIKSLSNLLTKISSMVIEDEIAGKVRRKVNKIGRNQVIKFNFLYFALRSSCQLIRLLKVFVH